MKKKPNVKQTANTSAIVIPTDIKNEFRKLCVLQDLKPSAVAQRLFSTWITNEKKKVKLPTFAANG